MPQENAPQHAPLTPWQTVMGFAPTRGTPGDELLAGARKLLAHLRREYARCLAAWRQSPDPRWRPYGLFGPHDTPILLDPEADGQKPVASSQNPVADSQEREARSLKPSPQSAEPPSPIPYPTLPIPSVPSCPSCSSPSPFASSRLCASPPNPQSEIPNPQSAARCPFAFWDPLVQIAAALQISEYQLTRYCKLASGLTARQWWDLAKAQDPATGVRARMREALLRDAAGLFGVRAPYDLSLPELLENIRNKRRARGEGVVSRALRWGYRNNARMQEAVFALDGRTVAELEMELLGQVLEEWRQRAVEEVRARNEAAAREAVARMARHEAQREAERQAAEQEYRRRECGAREDGDAMVQDAAPARAEGSGAAESSSSGSPAPRAKRDRDHREEQAGREDRVRPAQHRVSDYEF